MDSDKLPKMQAFSVIPNLLLLLLYLASAFYMAFGLSANSNAFDSPDTFIVLFFLVVTIPHAFLGIGTLIKQGKSTRFLQLSGILGLFLIIGGFAIGVNQNKILEHETKKSGDILLSHLNNFVSENGYCPKTLGELAETGITIPSPSIKKSTFELYAREKTCTLSFAVDSWVSCQKMIPNPDKKDWYCAD